MRSGRVYRSTVDQEDTTCMLMVIVMVNKWLYMYLQWPFQGEVTIQIVNWIGDHSHHKYTVEFDDSAVAAEASDRVWEDDSPGWGESDQTVFCNTTNLGTVCYLLE